MIVDEIQVLYISTLTYARNIEAECSYRALSCDLQRPMCCWGNIIWRGQVSLWLRSLVTKQGLVDTILEKMECFCWRSEEQLD